MCAAVFDGVAVIVDLTAGGWTYGRTIADSMSVPYIHGQVSIYQHMQAADALLQNRKATDAALIFAEEYGQWPSCQGHCGRFLSCPFKKMIMAVFMYHCQLIILLLFCYVVLD